MCRYGRVLLSNVTRICTAMQNSLSRQENHVLHSLAIHWIEFRKSLVVAYSCKVILVALAVLVLFSDDKSAIIGNYISFSIFKEGHPSAMKLISKRPST